MSEQHEKSVYEGEDRLGKRVDTVEQRLSKLEVDAAVAAERFNHLVQRFDRMEEALRKGIVEMRDAHERMSEKLEQRQQRMFWLLVSFVVAALGDFVIGGGLTDLVR